MYCNLNEPTLSCLNGARCLLVVLGLVAAPSGLLRGLVTSMGSLWGLRDVAISASRVCLGGLCKHWIWEHPHNSRSRSYSTPFLQHTTHLGGFWVLLSPVSKTTDTSSHAATNSTGIQTNMPQGQGGGLPSPRPSSHHSRDPSFNPKGSWSEK